MGIGTINRHIQYLKEETKLNNNRNTTFQVPNPERAQCMSTEHVDNLNKLA